VPPALFLANESFILRRNLSPGAHSQISPLCADAFNYLH
jgi:hypothetical protein